MDSETSLKHWYLDPLGALFKLPGSSSSASLVAFDTKIAKKCARCMTKRAQIPLKSGIYLRMVSGSLPKSPKYPNIDYLESFYSRNRNGIWVDTSYSSTWTLGIPGKHLMESASGVLSWLEVETAHKRLRGTACSQPRVSVAPSVLRVALMAESSSYG